MTMLGSNRVRSLLCLILLSGSSLGFQPTVNSVASRLQKRSSFLGVSPIKNPEDDAKFDPLDLATKPSDMIQMDQTTKAVLGGGVVTASALSVLSLIPENAISAVSDYKFSEISKGAFDPSNFQPVCAASDGFYRVLQSFTQALVGPEQFAEYGPLIAGGLLRIRLELCVVESFFNEAVGPFIQQNGLSWVLPLHETVETFLAGVVFSLATTFILVGSTKILTVIFTYADFLIGGPFRFVGGFAFDRARGKPVTMDIGFGPFKTRVIGPKEVADDSGPNNYSVDLSKTSPADFVVIVVSGGVKAVGQVLGVSHGLYFKSFRSL